MKYANKTGQVFGETSFFSGSPREFTAKCRVFTNVFSLSRNDFLSIINQSREDLDQFLMIKDQIIFTGKTTAFQSRCLSCGQFHSLERCDLFHYQPDKEKIIKKFEFSLFQNRSTYKRRRNDKFNSLDNKQKVSNQVKGWLREMLLERKKKEPEVRLIDLDRSSAVFSLDEQLIGSNESLQTVEVEEFLDQIESKETRSMSIHAPLDQMGKKETKNDSSVFGPIENGEKKEAKNPSGDSSQPAIEDVDEKLSRANSKSFVRLRSKKNSQISKQSGVLDKKTDVVQKSQVIFLKSIICVKKFIIFINSEALLGEFIRDFERAHKFINYFPDDNFDNVISRYEKNRKKTLILQKFRSGTLKPNISIINDLALVEEHQEKLKNMNLYTFYPDLIRTRLLKNLPKRQRPKRRAFKKEKSEEICSHDKKSTFFKRKEFENRQTFSAFVNSVISMTKTKIKKPKTFFH